MDKTTRLMRTIAGDETDRPPLALYRHWPGDDLRAVDLAKALAQFQHMCDWDFIVIAPPVNYMVADYGVQDVWEGYLSGQRHITRYPIHRSLQWTELRALDPSRGALSKQLTCIESLQTLLPKDAPVVMQIFSPLTMAIQLAGASVLLRHMRTQPERLKSGLNALTETVLQFVYSLQRTFTAGIHYVVSGADFTLMNQDEYGVFGAPYDWTILENLPERHWLNIVEVRAVAPMVRYVSAYPVQVLSWDDQGSGPTLETVRSDFKGALWGGINAEEHLHHGTPMLVRDAARRTLQEMSRRRTIIGVGQPIPVTTPLSNLRALRDFVEPGEAS